MFDKIVERLTVDKMPSPLISAKRAEEEYQHRKRGLKLSIIAHLFLLIIFIFPFISSFPPVGQEGIIINFGNTDTGQGNEQPLAENATPDAQPSAPSEPITDASTASKQPTPPTPRPKETPKPIVKKEAVTDDNADTPSVKKDDKKAKEDAAKKAKAEEEKREKDKAERKKNEAEQKKQAEAKAKQKAAEEAKRKAEEEARRKEEAKKKFGFPGSGNNTGQGDTRDSGDQGSSDGDPSSENLDTRQSGKGEAGEGIDLAGRSVVNRPSVDENSNEAGTVRVKICVNNQGKVVSAKSTLSGSTITNTDIIELAESKAKEFEFDKNNARREQCGSILFTFTVE